jgi:hypothetical protein
MVSYLEILSTNYNGQEAEIIHTDCEGNVIDVGTVTLPYNYMSEDYRGTYSIYIPNYDTTCDLEVPCLPLITDELRNPLISENGFYIIVE